MDFDRSWERLVRALSQSFFEVDQISKESRFISLSVKERDLEGLVDCGALDYDVNGAPWRINPAEDADFFDKRGLAETSIAHRTTSRIGKMNIFVAPEGQSTRVEINATFDISMEQSGESILRNLVGGVRNRERLASTSARFRFTTKKADQQDFGGLEVRCQSSGKWENQILDILR